MDDYEGMNHKEADQNGERVESTDEEQQVVECDRESCARWEVHCKWPIDLSAV